MAQMTMVQAINLALHQEMERDRSVIVLGEDVGLDEGVFRVTAGLIHKFGESRVVDTPLAESGIMGVAVGMAIAGLKPVAEIQFDGFSYIAFGQLEGNASRYRQRTQGQHTCPLVLRFPYGGGVRALEHHSEARESMYAVMPGVKVIAPSGPRNARALMIAAIRDPDPVVFMEPKRSYRAFREEVPDEPETLEIGKAQVVQEGTDVTVVTWGAMMRPTLQAVKDLTAARGANIELIDLLTLAPLDVATLDASIRKTGRLVVVQESPRSFGVASEIMARANDRNLFYLEAPMKRVTGYDVQTPYFGREEHFIPSPAVIRQGIEETLGF
jgi:pyruvate dehydrogenase E1 component beta subunit